MPLEILYDSTTSTETCVCVGLRKKNIMQDLINTGKDGLSSILGQQSSTVSQEAITVLASHSNRS